MTFGSSFDWGYEDKREIESREFVPGVYYWKIVKRGGSGYSESTTDSFTIDVARTVGFHEPTFGKDFQIYPDPCTNIINVDTSQVMQGVINLVAMNSKEVLSTYIDRDTKQIDLSGLENGGYLLTLKTNEFTTTKKVVHL